MRLLVPAILGTALLAAGCARQPERLAAVAISPVAESDPWENSNRKIYRFNEQLDRYLALPVTNTYRTVVPTEPRRGISNFYSFAREPAYFLNSVLQLKPKSAFRALQRIVVNGVLGLGVADHASDMGLLSEPHDFGQTLAIWGVPSGHFVYLPFIGPNTVRDAFGFGVDFLFDPADIARDHTLSGRQRAYMLGGRVIDFRSRLMDRGGQLLIGAADPYATTRAAWLQLRRFELFDGMPPLADDEDDLEDPVEAAPPNDSAAADPGTTAEAGANPDASADLPESAAPDASARPAAAGPAPDAPGALDALVEDRP